MCRREGESTSGPSASGEVTGRSGRGPEEGEAPCGGGGGGRGERRPAPGLGEVDGEGNCGGFVRRGESSGCGRLRIAWATLVSNSSWVMLESEEASTVSMKEMAPFCERESASQRRHRTGRERARAYQTREVVATLAR